MVSMTEVKGSMAQGRSAPGHDHDEKEHEKSEPLAASGDLVRRARSDEHQRQAPQGRSEPRADRASAEFETAHDVMHAAEKVRDAGVQAGDVHTPFPVHGMDRAMGLDDSRMGWIVICSAVTGLTGAFVMMHWMNGIDYPLVVGDKPAGAVLSGADIPGTMPSMVPILFELTILLSAFGAVFGMLFLNRLPQHHHPVFESDRFRAASDDKFFVSIEADDPKFDVDKTRSLLESTHASHVEVIEEDAVESRAASLPRWLSAVLVVAAVAGCRGQTSEDPPILPERNMYDSERYNPESYSTFFADHRTMRTPVEGTVRAGSTTRTTRRRRPDFFPTSPAT